MSRRDAVHQPRKGPPQGGGGPTPTKRTPERAIAICNALKAGATRRAAHLHAGMDQNTFYRWLADDVAFRDAVAEAEAAAELTYTTKVYQAAQDPATWQAAAWWLERRRHTDYARRERVDVSMELKATVRRLAADEGLDEAEIMAEVDRIVSGADPRVDQ